MDRIESVCNRLSSRAAARGVKGYLLRGECPEWALSRASEEAEESASRAYRPLHGGPAQDPRLVDQAAAALTARDEVWRRLAAAGWRPDTRPGKAGRWTSDPQAGDPCPRCGEPLLSCSPSGRGTAACDGCCTWWGEE